MSTAPVRKLTAAEYLAIERDAPVKSEFYAGEVIPLRTATPGHVRIVENVYALLSRALGGAGGVTLCRDQRVRVEPTGLYTYPDLVACSGPALFDGDDPETLLNPTLVVEVQWDGSVTTDRGRNYHHYRRLPAFREYLLIDQTEPGINRHIRRTDGQWYLDGGMFMDEEVAFATVPARVRLADVYAGVAFPDRPLR